MGYPEQDAALQAAEHIECVHETVRYLHTIAVSYEQIKHNTLVLFFGVS